jgi:formylglycine-generating enzyme required for sulfatase activity
MRSTQVRALTAAALQRENPRTMTTRGGRFGSARTRLGAAALACTTLAPLAASCASEGPPRGSLMVVVDTNVTPGRDFDTLRIRVQDDGSREIAYRYGWDEAAQRATVEDGGYLPLTVNVQNASDTLAARKVSVTAWKAGAPVFVRDAELVLPAAGTKALRLTVEALCLPPLAAEGARPVAWPERDWAVSCAEGQTCFAGSCAPAHVDVNALEEYAPERVFGGASGPGQGGACVDALGCFTRRAKEDGSLDEARLAQAVTPLAALGECVLDTRLLKGREDLIVAVELPTTLGVCGANGCLAMLDRAGSSPLATGWRTVGGALSLPKVVCDRQLRVFVRIGADATCPLKEPRAPLSGEASALGPTSRAPANRRAEPVVVDGGAQAGVVCASWRPSSELCAKENVSCGEVLTEDDGCALPYFPAERYAQCRGVGETVACASTDTAGMKRIPGGTYLMGSTGVEEGVYAGSNELPQHAVTVREFWLDTTEVTAGAFEDWCAGPGNGTPTCRGMTRDAGAETACTYLNAKRGHPMNCVSWYTANAYCAARGKRLPTEEEWEYAARSGTKQYHYPWGNASPSNAQLCWSGVSARAGTCPVGSFPSGASAEGVQDLAGNVWEWTASGYSESYSNFRTNSARVSRGGSWGGATARRTSVPRAATGASLRSAATSSVFAAPGQFNSDIGPIIAWRMNPSAASAKRPAVRGRAYPWGVSYAYGPRKGFVA